MRNSPRRGSAKEHRGLHVVAGLLGHTQGQVAPDPGPLGPRQGEREVEHARVTGGRRVAGAPAGLAFGQQVGVGQAQLGRRDAQAVAGALVHFVPHREQAVLHRRRKLAAPFQDMRVLRGAERIHPAAAHPFVSHQCVADLVVQVPGRVELELPRHAARVVHHDRHGFGREDLGGVAFEFLLRVRGVLFLGRHRREIGSQRREPLVPGRLPRGRELHPRRAGPGILAPCSLARDSSRGRQQARDVRLPRAGGRRHASRRLGLRQQGAHAFLFRPQIEQDMPQRADARQVAVGKRGGLVALQRRDQVRGHHAVVGPRQTLLIRGVEQLVGQPAQRGVSGALEGRRLYLTEAKVQRVHVERVLPDRAARLAL